MLAIRLGGSSYSFNFNEQPRAAAPSPQQSKSYLPTSSSSPPAPAPKPRSSFGEGFVPESSYHYGHSPSSSLPRQVGVIKPITREEIDKAFNAKDEKQNLAKSSPPPPPPPRLASEIKHHDNSNEDGDGQVEKEEEAEMGVNNKDKKSVPSPPPQTKVMNSTAATGLVSAMPALAKTSSSSSSASSSASEDEETASDALGTVELIKSTSLDDDAVEEVSSTVEFKAEGLTFVGQSEAPKATKATKKVYNFGMNGGEVDGGGGGGGLRESWKKRNKAEQQNTMVFNFINDSRDVTHIENDGLDLSKRGGSKKSHMRQLAKVGQRSQPS